MRPYLFEICGLALVLSVTASAQTSGKIAPSQQRRALAPRSAHMNSAQMNSAQQRPVTPRAAAQPFAPSPLVGGSDTCATPDVVVGTGNFSFDDTLATTGIEGQLETKCALEYSNPAVNNDVWFTWTAPATGTAKITTCGLTSVDTKLAVYAGNTCPAATALDCNDDDSGCGGFFAIQSSVSFACTNGSAYVIQLGNSSFGGPTGTGQFNISVATAPAFDDCATPQAIGSGRVAFDNTGATTGSQGQAEALCSFFSTTAIGRDLWYTWTAPSTGNFAVVTLGLTGVDTKIAVYTGAGCPATPSIACNDDGQVDYQSIAEFSATNASVYTIQLGVDVVFGGVPGTGQFQVIERGPRSNDDCMSPIAIAGTGNFPFDNTYSTTGTQGQLENACTLAAGSPEVVGDSWYVWTPGASGTATADLCPGTFIDTKIAVYASNGCPSGAAIACDDDSCGATSYQSRVTFPVVCGQDYTLQIGTYDYGIPAGGLGTISLAISGATTCPTPFSVFCAGDGTDRGCPCNNPGLAGRGCENTAATGGAQLSSAGIASIAADTLVLSANDAVPFGPGLFYEGDARVNLSAPFGAVFGNGLRCAGGTTHRLEVRFADGAGSSNTTVSLSGFGAALAGNTYHYQVWYRDQGNVGTCIPGAGFNLSNGISLAWSP